MIERVKSLEQDLKTKENEILAKDTVIATQAYDLKQRQKEIANLREQQENMTRKFGTNLHTLYLLVGAPYIDRNRAAKIDILKDIINGKEIASSSHANIRSKGPA